MALTAFGPTSASRRPASSLVRPAGPMIAALAAAVSSNVALIVSANPFWSVYLIR